MRVSSVFQSFGHRLIKDRVGAAIFFGTICFLGLFWQRVVFINDNYTIVNTLLNISRGELYFASFYGNDSFVWPGTVQIGNKLYGRSYGIAFAALPFLWIISLLEPVIGLRLIAVGFWGGAVFGLATFGGDLVNRRRLALLVAVVLVGAIVALNIKTAITDPLDPNWRYILALQLLAMTTTGAIGVMTYRIVAYVEGQLIGIYAGVATVLATNVGFWGWIPKRHVFVGLLMLVAAYGFIMSRRSDSFREEMYYRGGAYATIGLAAWINPAEAAVLFSVLVPLDMVTAPVTLKRLAVLSTVFGLSLVPFTLTNLFITGDPLTAPVMASGGFGLGDGGTAGGGTGSRTGGTSAGGIPFSGLFLPIIDRIGLIISVYIDGLRTISADSHRLYEIFVDRRYSEPNFGTAKNLTVLESTPIFAGLVGGITHSIQSYRQGTSVRSWVQSRGGLADIFMLGWVVLFTLIYVPRLPLRVQYTVRYLVPITPGLVFLLFRIPVIRQSLRTEQSILLWTYAVGIGIVSSLFVSLLRFRGVLGVGFTRSDLIALHGTIALICALLLGVIVVCKRLIDDRLSLKFVSLILGASASLSTTLILVSFNYYWKNDLWLFVG